MTNKGEKSRKKEAKIQQFAGEDLEALPDDISFSGSISKGGSDRLIINVPSGYNGLLEPGETINVTLQFPYRRLAKQRARLEKVRSKSIGG